VIRPLTGQLSLRHLPELGVDELEQLLGVGSGTLRRADQGFGRFSVQCSLLDETMAR
jgi:hypothetical protein